MSESFKPLDPLAELDRLAVDLDFEPDFEPDFELDFDLTPQPTPNRSLDSSETAPRSAPKVRTLSVGIRSLSNSPGAAPAPSLARESSRSTGSAPADVQPVRRARPVRVDAWAVPASANWTRTHKTIRKVRRVSRSTDWALPF